MPAQQKEKVKSWGDKAKIVRQSDFKNEIPCRHALAHRRSAPALAPVGKWVSYGQEPVGLTHMWVMGH